MSLKPHLPPPLHYSLRRSSRAKTARIVVRVDKIEVVAPPHVSELKIKAFVDAQQDWIRSAVLRVAENARTIPSLAPEFYTDGASIPYRGKRLPLQIMHTAKQTVQIRLQDDNGFIVALPADLEPDYRSELIRTILIRWMKKQARLHMTRLIEHHAPRMGLFPRSLKIKTQKSRWGSCGPNNDINLNWLLMLAPPEAMEYVVVHELCHIRHKNHSADFWGLVAEHLPAYQQQRQWLKQQGASLMKGL
ncbi:MAG: SprT family zinc-dependent metalloprotease [Methylococcales bacterium]|nr:SprT family zinc-dependent metalloprotease [Methylococcales bacterium]